MPATSDIINISVVVQAASVSRQGFGVPMILAPAAELPGGFLAQTTRTYSSMSSLATDFATGTSVNAIASAIFAQQPRPPQVKVGAMSVNPTQRFDLVPGTIDSFKFSGTIDGQAWSYTSGSSDTLSQICTGIASAISGLTLAHAVTVTTPSNTSVRVVAGAGQYHTMSITCGTGNCSIAQTHADPGLATDLAAILLADPAWYFPLFGFNSAACVAAISNWAESQLVMYVAQVQDSAIVDTTAVGDTTSIAYTQRAKTRTALIYKIDAAECADGAWVGRCGPLDPGSETWAYKTLAGVNPDALTETQRTNALAKHVNLYETIAGLNVTEQGQVLGSGQYIDVQRFIDWLVSNMGADIFQALANSTKIPYTDAGISMIKGIILARLDLGVAAGGLANSPAPVVVVPAASGVSSGDRAARVLNGVSFTARLAGAIHTTNITGTISA